MTIAGIEIGAIYVVMIACILVVALSLVGLCRASFMEHRYYRTRGRWHNT
ncbi:MAG TPA: hypothetical protein VFD50_06130 [Thermoleophilia bacterium]|nr:hypothetical protein [Thermoleophilia bacterium]